MTSRLANSAFRTAIARRRATGAAIVLSYLCGQSLYQRTPKAHGPIGSVGRVVSAGDNATMKSFFALLKQNLLDRQAGKTRESLTVAVISWIETTHHRRRGQHGVGFLTPRELETATVRHMAIDA